MNIMFLFPQLIWHFRGTLSGSLSIEGLSYARLAIIISIFLIGTQSSSMTKCLHLLCFLITSSLQHISGSSLSFPGVAIAIDLLYLTAQAICRTTSLSNTSCLGASFLAKLLHDDPDISLVLAVREVSLVFKHELDDGTKCVLLIYLSNVCEHRESAPLLRSPWLPTVVFLTSCSKKVIKNSLKS